MAKRRLFAAAIVICGLFTISAMSQRRTGPQFLMQIDHQMNMFDDITLAYRMTVKDSSSASRQLEFTLQQKGNHLRLIKFTSPDKMKGTTYLVTGPGTLYQSLPGQSGKFTLVDIDAGGQTVANSDMILEDLFTIEYSPFYMARYGNRNPGETVLEMTVRQMHHRTFPSIEMWVNPDNLQVSKIEAYDTQGTKKRTTLFENYQQTKLTGFVLPQKIRYVGHDRGDLETELLVTQQQFNTGLSDSLFAH